MSAFLSHSRVAGKGRCGAGPLQPVEPGRFPRRARAAADWAQDSTSVGANRPEPAGTLPRLLQRDRVALDTDDFIELRRETGREESRAAVEIDGPMS